MFRSSRFFRSLPVRLLRSPPRFWLRWGSLNGHLVPAAAQGTHLWTQSQMEEFEKGTPAGVSIESDGHLRQGPGLTELLTTPSTFVWSLAADKSGSVFAGTGSPAAVLRLAGQKGEKPFTLFETKDLSVQALRLGPDGSLYAATLPSGKVYKLNPDATTKLGRSHCHGRLRRRQAGRDRCRPEQGSSPRRARNPTTSGI